MDRSILSEECTEEHSFGKDCRGQTLGRWADRPSGLRLFKGRSRRLQRPHAIHIRRFRPVGYNE